MVSSWLALNDFEEVSSSAISASYYLFSDSISMNYYWSLLLVYLCFELTSLSCYRYYLRITRL